MADDGIKVGELARRTGLSVRTLHHYDDIGILAPRGRTASGHRIYGLDQVRRLQQIASLRQLGLSLEEIRSCLERPEYTLDHVLEMQIQRLRTDVERKERLVGILEELRRRLASGADVSMDDITATIEASVAWEKYYTPEQRRQLAQRAELLGEHRIRESQQEWAQLLDDFRAAHASGLAPDSPEVQALAARANDLIDAFTGGDKDIRASLRRMYEEQGGPRVVARHGVAMDADLWGFYGRALEAFSDRRAPNEGRS